MNNLLKISGLGRQEIQEILDLSLELWEKPENKLTGRNVVFAFEKPSLRTRVGTEVALNKLGAKVIQVEADVFFGGDQGREAQKDTMKNVNQWCDAIFARVFAHHTLEELAEHAAIPVVNALCDKHHPMQALADLLTLQQKFGRDRKIVCAWSGDANNVAFSLTEVLLKFGHEVRLASPAQYSFSKEQQEYFKELAVEGRGAVLFTENPEEAVKGAEVVCADAFVSMGEEAIYEEKIRHFAPYQVNQALFSKARKGAGFMHCLPAHRGEEVTDEVIDGENSWVYEQAKNRMVTAMGVFATLLGGNN